MRWKSSGHITAEHREQAERIRAMRHEAAILRADANDTTKQFVERLVSIGIPVRDIGFLVKLSPQRVSQIARKGARR